MDLALIIPAFIAGLFTFLAPCTLPLVPGYLGFISGTSLTDLQNSEKRVLVKKKILLNAIFYVIGFSAVFIGLGVLFGLGGLALGSARVWLSRIGGIFVIFFGLYMMHILELPIFNFMSREKHIKLPQSLKPGNPSSSFVFGATFAFGWTPCVGPILGSILLLASSNATVLQGAFLLFIFSLGLAIPFLALALGIGHAQQYVKAITKYMPAISFIGGLFILALGILLLTDSMSIWLSASYKFLSFINYDAILNLL
jgi:cytochrome c-type biogenesis protein